MKAGDTFLLENRAVDGHLWVVISDPGLDGDRVLFVSMTCYDITKENACLINVGEHPFVQHKTCIAYDFARVATLEMLNNLEDQGHLRRNVPISAELLERIRQGVSLSRRIEYGYVELMIEQGLLD